MATKRSKKKQQNDLAEMAKEATEAGMTYGKYVERLTIEKQMKESQKARNEKQERCITEACKECGLAGSVIWFSGEMKPQTHAQKIMREIVSKDTFPAKISFMFCDELDMCFFFGPDGTPRCSYSGTAKVGSEDIKHNIVEAFQKAEQVLEKMRTLYAKSER